jgi:nucleoid DNA-binding protein
MTKQELIERVYKTKGLPPQLTKKAVIHIIDAVFGEIGEYFIKNKLTKSNQPKFTYPGFGTFHKRKRPSRPGRNPQTGEVITIPEQSTVIFQPGQELKGQLNNHK